MSSIAAEVPRIPRLRPGSRALLVVIAAIGSVVLFLLLLRDAALPYPTFQGACERLRESGLAITSRDWFCHPAPWTVRAGYTAAALVAAAGFALPCAILLAAGRRITAALPALVLAFTTYPALLYGGTRWWQGEWPRSPIAAGSVAVLLVVVPVALVALARRSPATPRPRISLVGAAIAAMTCALAVWPLWFVIEALYRDHFRVIGETLGSGSVLWPAVGMALFAASLGSDRRWWPWSLAPVALLLSFAPSLALLVGGEGLRDWSMFGLVVPLFLVGLVWSTWWPLAARATRWSGRDGGRTDAPPGTAPGVAARPAGGRRSLALNAMAVVLLAWSTIAFVGDPLPAQISTPLPTYLGMRSSVEDVRLKMNLELAIEAMDRYRVETGNYRGFDAEAGAALEPQLAWTDRRSVAATPLWMWIVESKDDLARVAGVSGSGHAFCLQRSGTGLTLGSAMGTYGHMEGDEALAAAVSACGQTPWSPAAIQVPAWRTMCNGLDPQGGYLICRMVQVLNATTLRQTKPDGI